MKDNNIFGRPTGVALTELRLRDLHKAQAQQAKRMGMGSRRQPATTQCPHSGGAGWRPSRRNGQQVVLAAAAVVDGARRLSSGEKKEQSGVCPCSRGTVVSASGPSPSGYTDLSLDSSASRLTERQCRVSQCWKQLEKSSCVRETRQLQVQSPSRAVSSDWRSGSREVLKAERLLFIVRRPGLFYSI